jgi:hypothetical protein
MYLTRTKAKGNYYIYLRAYHSCEEIYQGKKYVYSFGRAEKAIESMRKWIKDFRSFPVELIELGCTRGDLEGWIKTLETGVTKTGKKINAVI